MGISAHRGNLYIGAPVRIAINGPLILFPSVPGKESLNSPDEPRPWFFGGPNA